MFIAKYVVFNGSQAICPSPSYGPCELAILGSGKVKPSSSYVDIVKSVMKLKELHCWRSLSLNYSRRPSGFF